ncbi:MAG TPA: PspC domain-containing protein [Solirubrobacteraceae bacterium]|jgi:phage shock protein PspC (stress-responsive transcriptional regulator)|nr:PspC domain-containing protein [Solirubrobacteraceae bacterium]
MTDTPPTAPQPDPTPTPPQPEPAPRRLTRSTTDSLIGGVAGGIGRHLNVDPLAIRITFVILTFAGGLGLVAYLLCLLFVPTDDPSAPPLKWGLARTVGAGLLAVAALAMLVPDWFWGPQLPLLVVAGAVVYLLVRVVRDDGGSHAGRAAAKIAIGIVLVALAVGAFVAAAAGTALGGGVVIAGLVIACGVGLVGGAFRGGMRWLIVPAIVLAVPLGAVAATDLDVRGTWGDRTFYPGTVGDLDQGYEMGMGSLKVDMTEVDLPAGRTDLRLEIGVGEIKVLVPEDVCVTTDAEVGAGAVNVGEGEQGGVDFDINDDREVAPGVTHLHVIADVGVGYVGVGENHFRMRGPERWRDEQFGAGASPAACLGAA